MMKINRWRYLGAVAFAALLGLAMLAVGPQAWAQGRGDPDVWIDFKKVERAQPALLQRQFASLAQRKTGSDIYVVGLAGWSSQDVFIKELDGAIAALGRVLPLSGDHVVRLINNAKTLDTVPVANPDNFNTAIRSVGQSMNKTNDVLIIFMTSHGTPNGVVLKLGRAVAELTPQAVVEALDREQIQNRIVIVSACFSGIYLKPLANDNTIILTAADPFHPSFGCSAKRSWTYFGDAFFNRSLQPGTDFRRAFADAKSLIAKWEVAEKLKPSNPQAHFGAALTRKLDSVWKSAAQKRS